MKNIIRFSCLVILFNFLLNAPLSAQVAGPDLTSPADNALNVAVNATFTWDSVASATQYVINISTDSLFSVLAVNKTVDTLLYSVTSLLYNQVYYWRVKGKVGTDYTDYSTVSTFKTKLATPVPLTPINGVVSQPINITLAWNSVGGANNYTLDVSVVSDFSDSIIFTQNNLTGINQLITGLDYNDIYYWRVKATQTGGNSSDFSAVRNFTTIKAGPTISTPANNALNYPYAKVTYTWVSLSGADTYELQVCKTDSFKTSDLKTYSTISGTSYTSATDYLTYNTKYYWRVRAKIGGIFTDYSATFAFTVGTPNELINDANARIAFNHSEGRITDITFKQGSNKQLLNTALNTKNRTGLGRISAETGTKLASWVENAGNYTYNYENTAFGTKSLNVKWDADSIVAHLTINLAAGKAAAITSEWQPGGDIGPLYDTVFYANPSDALSKAMLTYPGTVSTLFNGYTKLTGFVDGRFTDEYIGFLSPDSVQTLIQQALATGPSYTYPASSGAQTIKLDFAIMNKANFFAWAAKKYLYLNSPAAGVKLKDQTSLTVKWESFGVSGNIDIKLSVDGGATFPTTLVSGTANDGTQSVTLPDLSASVPLNNCIIKVSGTGASTKSGAFSIVNDSSSVFSIPTDLTGSPSDKIVVPVLVDPVTADSMSAIDIRLEYNKDVLTYVNYTIDPDLISKNWITDVANNSVLGYLQIGGFKNATGSAIDSSDTLLTVTFSIKNTARVGAELPFRINNSILSAANDSAKAINVLGKDGLLTVYSRVSGNLVYINSKRPIVGDSLIQYINVNTSGVDVDTTFGNTTLTGFYDFTNVSPGGTVRIEPVAKLLYPPVITTAVDAVDAGKAFAGRDGGSVVLTELQKVCADVNNDGKLTSTDALAILKISTSELTATDLGVNNWVFVDSSYKITAVNWALAPGYIIYSPLDTIKAKQNFWGAVRGDVDGDGYYSPSVGKVPNDFFAYAPGDVLYSVPSNLNAKPGDTLHLPLSVKLNGKSIGAFNTTFSVNKNLLTYTGKFTEGTSVPNNSGWYISTHFDSSGNLSVGATDFSGNIDAINKDGTIATFDFIVNNNAVYGDTSHVSFSYLSVADPKLAELSSGAQNGKVTVTDVTSANDENIIYEYSISQNYPNPFNPVTFIKYTLKNESKVEIEIYNSIGEKTLVLFSGVQPAGNHSVKWDATNVASGVYFYRIKAGEFNQTRKMVLLK